MASSSAATVRVEAPAKINWRLEVRGKRSDGFHEIATLMLPLCLADDVLLERRPQGLVLTAEGYPVPSREQNLAYRAAQALQEALPLPFGLRIHLVKRIPPGTGLGGGSSDAAAVLRGGLALLSQRIPARRLREMAARLGSDVPFFLEASPACAGGRGEVVRPVALAQPIPLVLVCPGFEASTKDIYEALKRPLTEGAILTNLCFRKYVGMARSLLRSVCSAEMPAAYVERLCAWLHNDLERTAFQSFPSLSQIKEVLLHHGARGALMTGSGSALFGVCASPEEAQRLAQALRGEVPGQVFVTQTRTG